HRTRRRRRQESALDRRHQGHGDAREVPMVTSQLRDVACARCGNSERRPRFEIRGWRIVACAACGMRYLSPRMPDHAYAAIFDEAERSFGGPFRVVTSWDVIEHLPDPQAHLETIARLMEPGGVLSIITPDRGSATARMFGARWVEYQKPEEHIHFFRRQDLRAM